MCVFFLCVVGGKVQKHSLFVRDQIPGMFLLLL